MDDIRPPRSSTNYQSSSKRPTISTSTSQSNDFANLNSQEVTKEPEETYQPHEENNYSLPPAKKSSNGLIVTLVLFILLFLGAVAFAGYEYMQNAQLKEDVAELKDETTRLTQKVYALEYDNRDSNQKLELANSEISSLEETKQLILDTCGSACADIQH